jgi:hypothetical protein
MPKQGRRFERSTVRFAIQNSKEPLMRAGHFGWPDAADQRHGCDCCRRLGSGEWEVV